MTDNSSGIGPDVRGRWIAWLFIVGSSLFALGAVPPLPPRLWGAAAWMPSPSSSVRCSSLRRRFCSIARRLTRCRSWIAGGANSFWVWAPRNLGWLACAVQLAGTLWFNWSTGNAMRANLTAALTDQRVWRPDSFGSIAFLIASAVALQDARRGVVPGRRKPRSWVIGVVNLAGSVAFGISAVGAFVIPSDGDVLNAELSNLGTFLGALCFLAGAILLLIPHAADAPVPAGHDRE